MGLVLRHNVVENRQQVGARGKDKHEGLGSVMTSCSLENDPTTTGKALILNDLLWLKVHVLKAWSPAGGAIFR
jgi:hypothetical protein